VRFFALTLLAVLSLPAQESIHFASVSGRVTDPAGAAVSGAAVVARQVDTNQSAIALTDSDGRFRFPYLRPGACEVAVRQPGFAPALRRLDLNAGAAFNLPISLTIESHEEAVLVTAEAARTQTSGSVPESELRAMPLNGRNVADAALLVPGVSPTNTGSNQLFAETSASPGQGISIAGQRNFSNSFIVDGLSANDDAAGLSGMPYSLDAVSELQVVTAGGQAEFGRALGGHINVITRSGANAFHADLYDYFRNQRLNAANPLLGARLPMTQSQYGASAGGPVVRDRTFFFVNFEQRLLNQSGLVTIVPATVDSINARLRAVGYPGSPVATGLFPDPVHTINGLAKVDHQFGKRDQFTARYSAWAVDGVNARGAGALSAPTASAALHDIDHSLAAGNVFTVSPRVVNETRAQLTVSDLAAPPADPLGPAVSVAGVASFGTLSGSPTGRRNRLYEAADNLTVQAGAHALRAGADFLFNDLAIDFPRSARGSYSFSSLANFLAGAYNTAGFSQTFGPAAVSLSNPNAGFYVQDEWKAAPRLTLNLGIRYDLQWLESVATDTNNIAPRAGFAWSPGRSQRTVVRGSFGLFYDRVPLRALANALLSARGQTTVSLSPAQAGAPVFPAILPAASVPAGIPYNLTTIDPRLQSASSTQAAIEVERQLGAGSVSIGYERLRGIHLIASINRNYPRCAASGGNNGCRPDPAFANIGQYSAAGDSWYDGLHVSLVQRPARWGSVRVSYAWSKAMDDVGEFFFSSPIDNANIWRDYGRSDDDQRHRLAVHATALAHGFQWSAIAQYYSALPLNVTSGANTIQGTAARPVIDGRFLARNAARGPDFFAVSARFGRSFHVGEHTKLETMIEGFNLLNRRNAVSMNGNFGPGIYPIQALPSFRQITAVGEPRSGQLAVRLIF
jgi:hypothetical protein